MSSGDPHSARSSRHRKLVARVLHRTYKLTLSPLIGQTCRFQPSCSDYALESIEVHGWVRGGVLAVRRVCRCHPWNKGGFDPVP